VVHLDHVENHWSKEIKVNLGKTKAMVSGSEGETAKSKIDPCRVCGKRVKMAANFILCTNCRKWVHGRCANIQRVTPSVENNFVCAWCSKVLETTAEPVESCAIK